MRELLIGGGVLVVGFFGYQVLRGRMGPSAPLGMSETALASWTGSKPGQRLTKAQRARAGLTGIRGGIDSVLGAWPEP